MAGIDSTVSRGPKMSYNGWTNYETWLVALEFFEYDHILENYSYKPDEYELAEALREEVEGYLGDNGSGVTLEYALAFVRDVNWREIAENMLSDWKEDEEEEEEDNE
jgi:hypothetical protein